MSRDREGPRRATARDAAGMLARRLRAEATKRGWCIDIRSSTDSATLKVWARADVGDMVIEAASRDDAMKVLARRLHDVFDWPDLTIPPLALVPHGEAQRAEGRVSEPDTFFEVVVRLRRVSESADGARGFGFLVRRVCEVLVSVIETEGSSRARFPELSRPKCASFSDGVIEVEFFWWTATGPEAAHVVAERSKEVVAEAFEEVMGAEYFSRAAPRVERVGVVEWVAWGA
jgi:hypothetical protein